MKLEILTTHFIVTMLLRTWVPNSNLMTAWFENQCKPFLYQKSHFSQDTARHFVNLLKLWKNKCTRKKILLLTVILLLKLKIIFFYKKISHFRCLNFKLATIVWGKHFNNSWQHWCKSGYTNLKCQISFKE